MDKGEDFINYFPSTPPSLKSIAMVPVVTSLFQNLDMKIEQMNLRNKNDKMMNGDIVFYMRNYDFSEIENKMGKRLDALSLPKRIKRELLNLVKPIGLELIKCFNPDNKEFHKLYDHLKADGSIFWTAEGTIDKLKTFEHWICDENRDKDPCYLFKTASKYFCDKYIFKLWEQLPLEVKERYFSVEDRFYNFDFTYYWICVINETLPDFQRHMVRHNYLGIYNQNQSIHENLMNLSIYFGNYLAVKYLWSKLSDDEKRNNIAQWLTKALQNANMKLEYDDPGSNEFTDIILYLISNLSSENQQNEFFQKYTKIILYSIYQHWPWKKYLAVTINKMWDYIGVELYSDILSKMSPDAKEGNIEEELIREIWLYSPKHFRKNFIQYDPCNISVLLKIEKTRIIAQLVKETIDERQSEIDIFCIIADLACHYGNYELIQSYLLLHFDSYRNLNEFKRNFLKKYFFEIMDSLTSLENGGDLLEDIVQYFLCTEARGTHFEDKKKALVTSFENSLSSACPTPIAQFKYKKLVSYDCMQFFARLICSKVDNGGSHAGKWESLKNSVKFFMPLSSEIIKELKCILDHFLPRTSFFYGSIKSLIDTLENLISYNQDSYDDEHLLDLLKTHLVKYESSKKIGCFIRSKKKLSEDSSEMLYENREAECTAGCSYVNNGNKRFKLSCIDSDDDIYNKHLEPIQEFQKEIRTYNSCSNPCSVHHVPLLKWLGINEFLVYPDTHDSFSDYDYYDV